MDNTASMTPVEKERHTTQLLVAWIAKLLDVSPAAEDESLRVSRKGRERRPAEPSGPRQLPDTGGGTLTSIN